MAAVKKARIGELLEQRHGDLVECFCRGPEILWNTGSRLQLVWPSLRVLEKLYFYIGREQAEGLFADVLSLNPGNCMQILGAKGSGKSTVMAAIAGYLHGSGMKRVVYVSGFHFAATPFPVLQEALMLSLCGQEVGQELWDIQDMKGLQEWCGWRGFYFVVDDWDKVEMKDTAKADLQLACEGNMLIRISSVNSRERYAYDTSDKAGDYVRTSEFDGPFTQSELQTWYAHSGLPVERLNSLDHYTGGMPRLARFYSESSDNEAYMENIARQVTSRVEREIVAHLTTKDRVVAALRLVTSHDGLVLPRALEGMKLACFYKKGNRYRILCPYLRTVAEEAIVSEGSLLDKKLQLGDVQTWIAAVQADLRAPLAARNPARIGWNVEGLVIGFLRVQGQLLPNYPFAAYRTYAHGKEIDALNDLDDDNLRGGVLLGPVAFNEKAVDVVYLLLRNGVIELVAVQITVAQWKAREKKKSHLTWKEEVLPKWMPGLMHQVQQKFLYVMPQSVQLEGVQSVHCKAFSELSPRLNFLNVLNLEEPEVVEKRAIQKCSGLNRDQVTPCGNSSMCTARCQEPCACTWYCYRHVGQARR